MFPRFGWEFPVLQGLLSIHIDEYSKKKQTLKNENSLELYFRYIMRKKLQRYTKTTLRQPWASISAIQQGKER